jgi:CBS domain-containing protein
VLSARENITDDASGILDEGVLESMAEYYSAELSQKIHRGMEINAQKCLSNGSNPGLGFKVDKDRRFYVDEEEGCQTYFNKKGKVGGVTKAPELVGIITIRDTIFAIDEGAVVCNTGVLGKVYEWNCFDPIKDIPNGVYLTGFFSNYPTQKMIQDIFSFMDEHHLKPPFGLFQIGQQVISLLCVCDLCRHNSDLLDLDFLGFGFHELY